MDIQKLLSHLPTSLSTKLLGVMALVLLAGCASVFGEDTTEEFYRAVGWEKPKVDDSNLKAGPPLTLPEDYDLVAPPDGTPPTNIARSNQGTNPRANQGANQVQNQRATAAQGVQPTSPQARATLYSSGNRVSASKPQFDSYQNIPPGVRAQFDNSLNEYSSANRRGLPQRMRSPTAKGQPNSRATTRAIRLRTNPAGDATEQQQPSPKGRAIQSEEFKPEPKQSVENVCRKVTLSGGEYKCLD